VFVNLPPVFGIKYIFICFCFFFVVVLYAVSASYFAGVMVRLMLTLTPIVCVSASIAFSHSLDNYMSPVMDFMSGAMKDNSKATKEDSQKTASNKGGKSGKGQKEGQKLYDKVCLLWYTVHCQCSHLTATEQG